MSEDVVNSPCIGSVQDGRLHRCQHTYRSACGDAFYVPHASVAHSVPVLLRPFLMQRARFCSHDFRKVAIEPAWRWWARELAHAGRVQLEDDPSELVQEVGREERSRRHDVQRRGEYPRGREVEHDWGIRHMGAVRLRL